MSAKKLHVGESPHGKAVFAAEAIARGELVVEFGGAVVERRELPEPYEEADDHYLQIGPDTYLGPSGEADDFVNHCCEPNCGLRFEDGRVRLVALRAIPAGEEITFDYSTTMEEGDWELECSCGAAACRGRIRDFEKLPSELRRRYLALGIVPAYLVTK